MVYFTGGEPLTKLDLLMKLIRGIKRKRRLCSITTNGTLIDRVTAEELVDSGLDIVTVSIDGDEEGHDAVRGRGAFQKAIGGIMRMVEAKRKRGVAVPFIKTSTTINDTSTSSLKSLAYILRELDVDMCQLQYPWFLPSPLVSSHKKRMQEMWGIECQGIAGYANDHMDRILPSQIKSIIHIFHQALNGRFSLFPDIRELEGITRYFNDLHFNFRKDCTTPWTNITIKADGRVNLCPDYYIPEYIIGYAQETDIEKLWNNKKARVFRLALQKHGSFPGCARCCGLFS
jgi:radical SAM protein with 4Fe4S-binding SPASM domain